MKEKLIITSEGFLKDQGICELTKDMDKYLYRLSEYYNTYIYRDKFEGKDGSAYALRCPGATIGAVYLDKDNIITKITLTKDIRFYGEGCEEVFPKYIGRVFTWQD